MIEATVIYRNNLISPIKRSQGLSNPAKRSLHILSFIEHWDDD